MGVRQLPPAGKRLAEAVWQALTDAGQPALNQPKLIPSRHGLLDQMYRAGVNHFRSYSPTEIDQELHFPVFVRLAEQHTGSLSPLLTNRKELESYLRWQRLRGYDLRELLVVEFCDTIDKCGGYRKYSAQYVAGEVAAQYLHVDKHWSVKRHGSTFRDEWAYEEREYVRENPRSVEIRNIFKMAKIEFGRLDYGLLNGKLQVWEINTNPSIGGPPPQSNVPSTPQDIRKLQEPARKLFFERFHTMLESIDSPHDRDVVVELNIPETDVSLWRDEVQAVQRRQQRRESLSKISEFPLIRRARDIAKYMLGMTGK